MGRASLWLGLFSALAFFALGRWVEEPFGGGAQRLLLVLYYGWLLLVAVDLSQSATESGGS